MPPPVAAAAAGVRPPGPLFIEPGALQPGYPGIAPASSGTETNAVPGTAAPAVGPGAAASGAVAGDVIPPDWSRLLAQEASRRLAQAHDDPLPPAGEGLMNELTRRFEATLIRAALEHTGGRRVQASLRLGIGRNTLTRKIQELGIDDA